MAKSNTNRVRLRSANRDVAMHAVSPGWHEAISDEFSDDQRHSLLVPLSIKASEEDGAIAALEELAGTYSRWRKTPKSSKEIAKRDLLSLAELCDELVTQKVNDHSSLVQQIVALDSLAETLLWAALRSSDDWPDDRLAVHWLRENPIPSLVAEAARSAADGMKGGDYPDVDLHAALAVLIDLFEHITGKQARAGRKASDTAICTLAYAFFAIVDPSIERHTNWNSLDRELRARRRRASRELALNP